MSENAPTPVILDRRDPARNMHRFYVLSIEPSLFGGATLVREWGRIGHPGRRRIEIHESQDIAVAALQLWLRRKLRRGYRAKGA